MDHSLATTCSRIFIYFCHTVLSKQATLPFFPYFFNLKNVFNFYSVVSVSAMCACVLSHVQLSVTPGTVAHQAASFMGFSRLEYWSGLPCPPPGDLPDPGIEPIAPASPALTDGFFTTEPPEKPHFCHPTVKLNHNYTYTLFILPLLPPSYPSRPPQSTRQGFLCYTATSHQLSILYLIVYICWCYILCLSQLLPSSIGPALFTVSGTWKQPRCPSCLFIWKVCPSEPQSGLRSVWSLWASTHGPAPILMGWPHAAPVLKELE